jgi:hypothetical protein
MSPQKSRDLSVILVQIQPSGGVLGSGKTEQGGGPLRGGLLLMNRFTAEITDPAVPYRITMTVGAQNEALACESFQMAKQQNGPSVTTTSTRMPVVDSYLIRIREELKPPLLMYVNFESESATAFSLPTLKQAQRVRLTGRGPKRNLTTSEVAKVYRDVLQHGTRDEKRAPIDAVAKRLQYSRGHISRLLTQARREGKAGVGEPRR